MFDFFKKKKNDEQVDKELEDDCLDSDFDDEYYEDEKIVFETSSQQSSNITIEKDDQDDVSFGDRPVSDEPIYFENLDNDSDNNLEYESDNFSEYDKNPSLNYTETTNGENDEIEDEKIGFFERLKEGLVKTRDQFSSQIKNLFTANVKIDDDMYEELEEILISADIGMDSTLDIVDSLRDEIKRQSIKDSNQIYPVLKDIMIEKLDENNLDNNLNFQNISGVKRYNAYG